jgi:hypothetical protein
VIAQLGHDKEGSRPRVHLRHAFALPNFDGLTNRRHLDGDPCRRLRHVTSRPLGDLKPRFDCSGGHQGDDRIAWSNPLAGLDVPFDHIAVERRRNRGVVEPDLEQLALAFDLLEFALGGGQPGPSDAGIGLGMIVVLLRHDSPLNQLVGSCMVLICLRQFGPALIDHRLGGLEGGLALGDLGAEAAVVESGQHVSFRDADALAHQDGDDPPVLQGGDLGTGDGAQATDDPMRLLHLLDGHRLGSHWHLAVLSGGRRSPKKHRKSEADGQAM